MQVHDSSGISALLLKFIPPETLKRSGGAQIYAQAIDACLDKLAGMLAEPEQIRRFAIRRPLTALPVAVPSRRTILPNPGAGK